MVRMPTGVLAYSRGSNMKLHSRPISWSLALLPMLAAAVLVPGNAYSQQPDRVASQQDHRQRARGEERANRKIEKVVESEETPRNRPPRSESGPASSEQARANRVAREQRTRPVTSRSNSSDAGVGWSSGNRTIHPPVQHEVAPDRNSRIPVAAADRRSYERPNEARSQQRHTQYREQSGRPTNRQPIAAQDHNRRPGNTPGPGRGQLNRDGGDRADNNRGYGSQAARSRQSGQIEERRIRADQHQANRYYASQTQQRNVAAQRARILQQQRRTNQYRYQDQYQQRLQQQRLRWSSLRYDYYSDPFYSTPVNYRYQFGGQWHTTNRYGADLMQQAVEYGYQEGLRAGEADRHDRWRADFGNSYAYQDGSYGYNGRYISPSEYQHYFRQGFRRGYEDGYSARYNYGYRQHDGNYVVVAAVLAAIVGLHLLN